MTPTKIKNTYSIDEVSEIARVNSFTLRNWEDRYQLFNPFRDANGRRIFTENETLKAIYAAQLVEKDHKIGKVAQQLIETKDLNQVLNEYLEGENFVQLRTQALESLFQLDSIPFRMMFDLLVTNYSLEFLVDHFFYPIFRKIEAMRINQEITRFQEKFTLHHLCSRIHRLIGISQINRTTPYHQKKVLITGLPRNQLEDSVLLLYLMLERCDWKVFYAGPEMLLEELDLATKATGVDVVILVGNNLSIQEYMQYAPALEQISAPIILGGKLSLHLKAEGYTDTSNVELNQLRPGPLSKLLNYKINRSL